MYNVVKSIGTFTVYEVLVKCPLFISKEFFLVGFKESEWSEKCGAMSEM